MSDPGQTTPCPEGDFFRQLCQHAAIALVAAGADDRITVWNDAARELLGRTAEEMIGRSIYDLVPDNRHKLLGRLLQRTRERGVTNEFEIHRDRPGQERQYLMIILSPIRADDGQAMGVAAWVVDQTGRKRVDERLVQAEKLASLGTLASGVAHHFNNILGGVATFVDFALTSGDTPAMKRALQMTAEASARASKITQSLLSFAKHDEQGKGDLADLTEVVLTFVHLVERPLAENNIELKLDLAPVPILPVEANRMHQVLGNLLTNAEEAMPEGGRLEVSVTSEPGKVALRIADTGVGISPEDISSIFEPFFTTKGLHAGGEKANPGLGLSVVHGLVVEMGGQIRAESTAGEGTTFTITFPIARDAEPRDPSGGVSDHSGE
jgi:PAS domain S-box-containing protein